MTDALYAMYPDALDCGMSAETFWDATPMEILDVIESHRRKKKREQTMKIERLFVLAEVIVNRVAYGFSEKKDPSNLVQPWDMYPQLFPEEKRSAERAQEEQELENYKEARRKHAAEFNRRRREADQ